MTIDIDDINVLQLRQMQEIIRGRLYEAHPVGSDNRVSTTLYCCLCIQLSVTIDENFVHTYLERSSQEAQKQ